MFHNISLNNPLPFISKRSWGCFFSRCRYFLLKICRANPLSEQTQVTSGGNFLSCYICVPGLLGGGGSDHSAALQVLDRRDQGTRLPRGGECTKKRWGSLQVNVYLGINTVLYSLYCSTSSASRSADLWSWQNRGLMINRVLTALEVWVISRVLAAPEIWCSAELW
jgi:hypothetical protein